ncbi:hypothetical protein BCR34DRAFT_597090 [Clohesyomyces aquaticus]|uniref:BTB domain-containing protein n=1 Tax=Clohesyomyces aquaticus TaxID=1231657 RepID=A0A1Y2A455_9PLEO|nr:hypothetical protein BCR34DRAFT_597090 [Clohesyomyces aquaticus]
MSASNSYKEPKQFEKEEQKLDLPDDEPALVKLFLQFLYEMDYHIPKKEPGSEPATLCLEIVWGNDQLERRVRRNLDEGLAKLNDKAMGRTADIAQGHRSYLLPDENNSVAIDSSELDISIIFELTTLINDPGSSNGPPVYRPDLDVGLMIYAKVYCVAEKYNIKALKELAVENLTYELPHVMVLFTNNEIFDVIDYIFSNSLDTKGCEMRRLLASEVYGCLKIFGMKSRIEEKMKQYPDLALLNVQETFGD